MTIAESVLASLLIAVYIGCVALWGAIISRSWKNVDIVPYAARQSVPWRAGTVALVIIGLLVLQTLCAIPFIHMADFAGTLDDKAAAEPADADAQSEKPADMFGLVLATSVGSLLTFGIATLWLRRRGATYNDLGLDFSATGRDIVLGFAGFVAASVPVYVAMWLLIDYIPPKHAVNDIFHAQPGVAVLLATAVMVVFVAPLTEEFFYRVILQGWLEALYAARARNSIRNSDALTVPLPAEPGLADESASEHCGMGDVTTLEDAAPVRELPTDDLDAGTTEFAAAFPPAPAAMAAGAIQPRSLMPVLISSFVFALLHLGNGPSAIPLFFFALGLGYLYRQTHRLLPSVVMHAGLNAVSTIMLAITSG